MGLHLDPSTFMNLLVLIIIEVVLGLDNLIFLTILVKKLPPQYRKQARVVGLFLSLCIRIVFLSFLSWSTSLKNPFYSSTYITCSVRQVIFFCGGLFLSSMALIELYNKAFHIDKRKVISKKYSKLLPIVFQLVALDVIFSLDSIITAIGIMNNIILMSVAVTISMFFMLLVAKPLKRFMDKYRAIFAVCLSFLVMIGVSLILESFTLIVPKNYLYFAVGFSIFIEFFNQISKYNLALYQHSRPIRTRILEKVFKILKSTKKNKKFLHLRNKINNIKNSSIEMVLDKEEEYMIYSLLNLAIRPIKSIMTPREEISWININDPESKIKKKLLKTPHNIFPVCQEKLDNIIGVIQAKKLLSVFEKKENVIKFASKTLPIIILDNINPINLLKILKKSRGNIIIVKNKFNIVQGLITPLDFLKAIAGDFPDSDETPDIVKEKNSWLVKGNTNLHALQQFLNCKKLFIKKKIVHASIAGLLLEKKGSIPIPGDVIKISSFYFNIIKVKNYKIDLIRITKKKKKKKKK
ncbi:TerC family protein [Buchnera aphidicola]|uniref:TerC family protein n=1 Tax=Buchnera aphidicola TaxID=9 RepID=UPI0025435C48|nr:transporter associated domain-containing protein [Buchnera aphidicola]WII23502.1 transporter associated domain-containing protein [Buchnera aphidicola (Sipha maydis)]